MRIMHVVSVWDGGVKGQVLSVAERMAADGHQILIAALRNKHDSGDTPSPNVEFVDLCGNKSLLEVLKAGLRAHALVRSFKPDVVHGHSFHANIFSRLLRLTARIPYEVNTFHCSGTPSNNEDGRCLYTIAYRLTDALTDISTNVSREASESFVQAGALAPGRIVTVYDGIDTDKFSPRPAMPELRRQWGFPQNAFVWLAVGRLCVAKDYPNLLRAFAQLIRRGPDNHLIVVGDGPLDTELQAQVKELGLGDHVRFLGRRGDVPLLMNAADAYVLSSAFEGFPNCLAEAMASGLPSVATDCGGVRELVADCGGIVPVNDSEALALKMREMSVLAPSLRFELGRKARKRVCDLYSLKRCCDQWLTLYRARIKTASDWCN